MGDVGVKKIIFAITTLFAAGTAWADDAAITIGGVEMLTTYSDQDGELVVRHYCGLGTEPVFKLDELTANSMSIAVDEERSGLHRQHHSFVTGMKWTMDASNPNKMVFENTVILDGEITNNRAELSRVL